MSQKKGRAAHANLLYDGSPRTGLNKITAIKPVQGELEVGENGRIYSIGDGQTKWAAIEGAYIDETGQDHEEFFRNWLLNKEQKDVTYIRLDGSLAEIQRIILPNAECLEYSVGEDYDANGINVSVINFKLAYYEPIFE